MCVEIFFKGAWLSTSLEYSGGRVEARGSDMAENVPGYPRHTPQDRSLRAANADRDAIGDILRRQHVAGRLDTDEFAERYGRSLQAKTYAELDELIADLPADTGPAAATAGAAAGGSPGGARTGTGNWRGGARRAGWLPRPVPVFIWLAVVVAIAVASGGRLLWVAFPLFFFVVRPLMWRSGWWGRSGGWGPWGCYAPSTRRGTTIV
jgi:hypothetical protein